MSDKTGVEGEHLIKKCYFEVWKHYCETLKLGANTDLAKKCKESGFEPR